MLPQRLTKHLRLRCIGSTIWCKTSLDSSLRFNFLGNLFLAFPTMVVVSEVVHPRNFGFPTQKQVHILRKVDKLSWPEIAAEISNLQGTHPKLLLGLLPMMFRRKPWIWQTIKTFVSCVVPRNLVCCTRIHYLMKKQMELSYPHFLEIHITICVLV